jgi:archaetidylinositol phosphate synthase
LLAGMRKYFKSIVRPVAYSMARAGISGNQITLAGLILSVVFVTLIYLKHPLTALIVMALSSLMDALDGEVARIRGEQGPRGGFLDSTVDRLEDTLFISSLYLLGFPPFLVSILVGLSLTTSYIRAKAESLGLKLEGRGIIERGERLLMVFLVILLRLLNPLVSHWIFLVFLSLSAVTVVQRILISLRKIG